MINYDKSILSFSPCTSPHSICDLMGVISLPVVQGHYVYLGLPTFSLRNKQLQFGYIFDRVAKKFKVEIVDFFSVGGREVLIKSVLQNIPSYAMSCFRIPASICHKVEQACAKFW